MYEIILFKEEQRFRQGWIIGLLAAVALIGLAGLGVMLVSLTMAPQPDEGEMSWWLVIGFGSFVLGIVVPLALFWIILLEVVVTPDALRLRFHPFVNRHIPRNEIARAEAVNYRPFWDYGGWGIRISPKGRAYTVSGDEGVMITLTNGNHFLIGSLRAKELARALSEPSGDGAWA